MPYNPCCQQQSEHKIRFTDNDSSEDCIIHSRKTLDAIQDGVILANTFKVIGEVEHRISRDESKTPYVKFVVQHILTKECHTFIAENITNMPPFQFTP